MAHADRHPSILGELAPGSAWLALARRLVSDEGTGGSVCATPHDLELAIP